MNCHSKRSDPLDVRYARAFTLIELLVVIAIIGLLAGLVIPLAGIATTKMRLSRVQAELNRYANAIETYKLETGQYPQDHGFMRNMDTSKTNDYRTNATLNPLFYELSGAIFTNKNGPARYVTIQEGLGEEVTTDDLEKAFKVNGLRNSARVKNDIDFKGFNFKNAQYAEPHSTVVNGAKNIKIIVVPVPGPFELRSATGNKMLNPWFYDASSTNRHNKSGFDLWAEIFVGGKTQVVANWKM
jgi:prepilin-type N-terminal cleavage/methylation domain-containing protein